MSGPTDPRSARSGPSAGSLFLLLALCVLAFAVARGTLGVRGSGSVEAEPRPVAPRGELLSEEEATIGLFERTSPSVVHINTSRRVQDALSLNVLELPEGSGSGFLWDEEGHVVTNFHVIQGADSAVVTLSDHGSWPASLVGYDADFDLAVLRIEAPPERLRPIDVGTSSDLKVGQKVFAIGNPFGLDQTLTTGIISGLGREILSVGGYRIRDVVQTDAAINPGNSGGPLLDSAGRLIGVNTAILSRGGASSGVGFAVPVDAVNRVVPSLVEHGRRVRAGLGVYLVPDSHARRFGVERGALVHQVVEGGAAEHAGLRPTRPERGGVVLGDVIVAVDGEPVRSSDDLMRILDGHAVGDEVTVTVRRDGRETEVDLRLQAVR